PMGGPGSSPGARTIVASSPSGNECRLSHNRAGLAPLVQVGDVVDVLDGELNEWWRIVPHHEADAMRRCISVDSPLARALLGHSSGEVVHVRGRAVTIVAVKRLGCSE